MSDNGTRLSRRTFLLTLGASGAAGAAAMLATTAPQRPPAASANGKRKGKGKGYHASEHVQNYYRTAKV